MSQENVEIVRRIFDAEGRRDRAVTDDLIDPDVEMDFSESPFADFTTSGSRHGLDQVRSTLRDWYDAFDNVETVVNELVDAGEHVISVFTYRGTGRASGAAVEWKHMAGLWTLRDGKVVRVAWLRTREQALEAAGLSAQQ